MLKRALGSAGNIFWLGTKELRSFLHDTVLIVLVIYAFSFAVISQALSNSQELNKASIAFSDEDNSPLSRRIIHASCRRCFCLHIRSRCPISFRR